MCERLLNLQEIYVSGQNICIEVYGNSVGTISPHEPAVKKSKWRILENPGPGFRLNERIIAGIRLPVRSRGNSL